MVVYQWAKTLNIAERTNIQVIRAQIFPLLRKRKATSAQLADQESPVLSKLAASVNVA